MPPRLAVLLALVGALAACGDAGTAPSAEPPPPAPPGSPPPGSAPPGSAPASAHAWQSPRADAMLDSLFGADAVVIDSALAAEGRALDARAAAWVDSVAAALVPDVPAAASARGVRDRPRAAAVADPTAERTFSARADVATRGGVRAVRLDYSYALTITDERIQLDVVDADVVYDGSVIGTPMEQDFSSYTRILTRNTTVVPCPDAAGQSVGTWKGELASYGARAGRTLAGREQWTFRKVERAVARPIRTNVGDDAFRRSFDYEFAYDVDREQGKSFLSGGAELRRTGFPIADVILPVESGALTNVTGDYALLSGKFGAADMNALHFWLADDLLRTSAAAQRVWRGGRCVEVREPGGPVQPASPNARMTLRPVVVHRVDGTRPPLPIEARGLGGTVSPEGAPVSAPAAFAYTATATGAGRVTFRTVSKRGIGTGDVAFTPLQVGGMFEYESTTAYALDSRDDDVVVTGSMRGTQRLTSTPTLLPTDPDEGDDRAFLIATTTDVRVDAIGEVHGRGPTQGRYTGDGGFRISAVGTSRNPATDAAPFDQVGTEQFPSSSDVAGALKLFRRGGRDYYAFDLSPSGVVGDFEASAELGAECATPAFPPSRATLAYSNATRRETASVTDPGGCWPGLATDASTLDLPYGFGAVGLDRTQADRVTGRSEMFVGTYDARAGVIEGSETRTVDDCDLVGGRDPLQLARMLRHAKAWSGDLHLDQGKCSFTYTVRWRFLLPPR